MKALSNNFIRLFYQPRKALGAVSITSPKVRNSSVEFLRCALMFLIVLHHSWIHGEFGIDVGYEPQGWMPFFFGALLAFHVDSFVGITGCYGIRFSWRKFLALYSQIVFYSVLWWIMDGAFHGNVIFGRFELTGGWFGDSYLMLMFVAPLINAAIDKVHEMHGGGQLHCLQ